MLSSQLSATETFGIPIFYLAIPPDQTSGEACVLGDVRSGDLPVTCDQCDNSLYFYIQTFRLGTRA